MEPQTSPSAVRQLRRGQDRKIAGVCSGIADYFRVDATLVRLLFLGGLLLGASSIIVYLAGWVLMPGPVPVLPAASSGPTADIGPPPAPPAPSARPEARPQAPPTSGGPSAPSTLPPTGTDGPEA